MTNALKNMLVVFLAFYVSLLRIDKIKRAQKRKARSETPRETLLKTDAVFCTLPLLAV